jgi:hypothetical protein
MAEIHVERKSGNRLWFWILAAVLAVIVAVVLLDYAGYIQLPAIGAALPDPAGSPALAAALAVAAPMEV